MSGTLPRAKQSFSHLHTHRPTRMTTCHIPVIAPLLKHGGFRKSYAKAFVECRSELDASTEMPTILPSKTIGLMSPNPKEATVLPSVFLDHSLKQGCATITTYLCVSTNNDRM